MSWAAIWAWFKKNIRPFMLGVIVGLGVFVIGGAFCSGDAALENAAPVEVEE